MIERDLEPGSRGADVRSASSDGSRPILTGVLMASEGEGRLRLVGLTAAAGRR